MTLLKWFVIFSFSILTAACSEEAPPSASWQQALDGAYAADISADGQLSLVSSIHHGLTLWNIKQQRQLFQWNHQNQENNQVFLVKIADGNRYAISASRDDFVIWDIATGQAQGYWKISESSIRDIALSSNGKQVLIGLGDGKVIHLDLVTGRRLEFLGHSEKINSVALSANGRYALTGGNDYQALFWDTQTAQVLLRFPQQGRVSMVALEPDGKYAFTADNGKLARIWALPSGERVSQLKLTARQSLFSYVRFAKQGEWLITGSAARKLSLWHVASGQALQQWLVTAKQKTRPKSAVVYSAAMLDNSQLVSASSSGFVEIWDIKN
ncbi:MULTISPECIES: WD40 repeat domain-containing protein [unclassified Agarivorans]|uniref:WD40 repeat domain-containing protein n=1 Tax=unclassified Agarivorans TaxID=2636026 RepID=UPI003D7D6F29